MRWRNGVLVKWKGKGVDWRSLANGVDDQRVRE